QNNQEAAQETLAPLTDQERALSLRELIANQPDFAADLEFFVAEHKVGGAYGFNYRLVRKGVRFPEQSEFWTFFGEIGKHTAQLFPRSRSYDDMKPLMGGSMKEGGLLSNPSLLLADAGLTLTPLGKLEIDGHDCIKIEATQKARSEKIYLYAARDLKN